jgi:quinol monooxygenase YgiN
MDMVTFQMTINDPDKRDEIVSLLAEINKVQQSGKDGCIIHDWYANVWDPNRIRLYTELESHEALLAGESDPTHQALAGKLFEYHQSGALTMDIDNLRRYELDKELAPMEGMR